MESELKSEGRAVGWSDGLEGTDATLLTKEQRADLVNNLIWVIAQYGRKFFRYTDRVSRFEVDRHGKVWFVDAYSQQRIYTHYRYEWRGFTNGGTLRVLVEKLRDFIRTGEPQGLNLGPWPQYFCEGDLWGYGADMERVRISARANSLVPSNAALQPTPAGRSAGSAGWATQKEDEV